MNKLTKSIALILCTMSLAIATHGQSSMDYTILIEDIEFTPDVFIDINVNVYVNENALNWANHGKILAIEGMAHTANCMKPLAEELFLNPPQTEINEFYAIDMPGRGGSGLPEGDDYLLEDMYIEDYIVVIRGVLDYLNNDLGVYPSSIMGHSLGGLEVIMLQDVLVKEGSNMRKAYGIKNAVLLAPAPPAPVDWAFIEGPGSDGLAQFAMPVPGKGLMLNIPCQVWPFLFFTNTCCYFPPSVPVLPPGAQYGLVPGAPTPQYVCENGYAAMEPGPLCYQIAGREFPPGLPYPYKPRVEADADIFKPQHGVQLSIISDEFDKMMTPDEEMALYEYLTGDMKHKRLYEVTGDHTCHDTHISDPAAIVELLEVGTFKDVAADKETTTESEVTVFPNPAKNSLMIVYSTNEVESVEMMIMNALGSVVREVEQTELTDNQNIRIDISGLPSGIYFLRYKSGEEVQTKKFTKIN